MTESTLVIPAETSLGSRICPPGRYHPSGLGSEDCYTCCFRLPDSWRDPAGLDGPSCLAAFEPDRLQVTFTIWLDGSATHQIEVGSFDMEGDCLRSATRDFVPLVRTDMRPTHGFPPAWATVELDQPFDTAELKNPSWGPDFYARFRIEPK